MPILHREYHVVICGALLLEPAYGAFEVSSSTTVALVKKLLFA